MNPLPVVGVMGSGTHPHAALSVPLGRALAGLDVHLLTGGGRGVMEAVSRAFAGVEGRSGLVIGVIPAGSPESPTAPLAGYPNPWVEIAVRTHLVALGPEGADATSRNHINVLTSAVVVALPGSQGTASEVRLAVRYGRPLVLLGDLERARGLPPETGLAETVDEALGFVRAALGLDEPGRSGP